MSEDLDAIKNRILKFSVKNGDCIDSLYKSGGRHRMTKFGKRSMGVHRISWIVHFGDIPKGKWVCHKCDNPKCINPDHLFLGSPQDNTNDMKNKNRQDYWGRMKYSDEIADHAIHLKRLGMSYKEIGKELNIPMHTVHSFFRRPSIKEKVKDLYDIPKYSQEVLDKVKYLKELGVQHQKIEKVLGIPKRTLVRMIQKMGLGKKKIELNKQDDNVKLSFGDL